MTHEDSVQIEATSPASPRAGVRRCATAWERGLTFVSGKGRASVAGAHDPRVLDPSRASTTVDGGLGCDRLSRRCAAQVWIGSLCSQ
jgi:hypothetical protein